MSGRHVTHLGLGTAAMLTLMLGCWGRPRAEDTKLAEMREALSKPAVNYRCQSAREFVTTYNFLSDAKYLNLSSDQVRGISERVIVGCDGSARRFVEAVSLLSRARLDSRNSIRIGERLALATDAQADTFMDVFKRAYLKKYLDLDLLASIRIAESLSIHFEGSPKHAREDYTKLVEHCLDKGGFNLPRPACSELAMRLTRYGQGPRRSIAKPYLEGIEFLTRDDDGPKLTLQDALKLAEELVAASPDAVKNFEKTYEFAVAKKGLALERARAVQQARTVALFTRHLEGAAVPVTPVTPVTTTPEVSASAAPAL